MPISGIDSRWSLWLKLRSEAFVADGPDDLRVMETGCG